MIKLVVFDFDGVFSDGKFYFNNNGLTTKSYNAKDAFALKILKKNGIKTGLITNDYVVSAQYAAHIFDRLDKCSINDDLPKDIIMEKWLKEYNLSYDEIAFIGDDLSDIPLLEKVFFSGCPSDAIQEVKEICSYICDKKGGEGAVREFVDLIIKKNTAENNTKKEIESYIPKIYDNNGEITAVIPVRKGSTRCQNKNFRKFADTDLLSLKINTLKKVKGIKEILVSSNCDQMLNKAHQLGVKTYKREEKYCTNENPGAFFCNLAKSIDSDILMHVPVTTPLISSDVYNDIIEKWNEVKKNHGSLNTVTPIKEFIWYNGETVNYNESSPPPSQNLPQYESLNFACNIINKKYVLERNNIVGENPYMYQLDKASSVDIDENTDFLFAELLYENSIINDEISKIILERKNRKIELLDCTLRDGGYLNNWEFEDQQVLDCYETVTGMGYDYFEIGFRTNKDLIQGKGKWCYSSDQDISNVTHHFKGCKIAVMAKVGTVTINDFVKKKDSPIDLVRVLLARASIEDNEIYSKFTKKDLNIAKELCLNLIEYGYEVTLNLGCSDLLTVEDISLIVNIFYDIKIKSIYLADTFGKFTPWSCIGVIHTFYKKLAHFESDISLGIHAHNNNGNALSKTIKAIEHGCSMLDTSIGGLGRGAGNLKTEEYLSNVTYKDHNDYLGKMEKLIIYYDKYILKKNQLQVLQPGIVSHPYYQISGNLSLHPNYVKELLDSNDTITEDIKNIMNLNNYTIKHNKRNYDKELISNIKSKSNTKKEYDICYSILFHQGIDLVNYVLKNIEKYNSNNKYIVIVHLCESLYKQRGKLYSANLLINDIHYDKQRDTIKLFKPHLENFKYLYDHHIDVNNFMLLSSACRFVKQAPHFHKNDIELIKNEKHQNIAELRSRVAKSNSNLSMFLKNKKIVKLLEEKKIEIIKGCPYAQSYPVKLFDSIYKFIYDNNILGLVTSNGIFEEVLIATLRNYYTITKFNYIQKTYSCCLNKFPSIDYIKNVINNEKDICIVKRFPDVVNHPNHKFLDSLK